MAEGKLIIGIPASFLHPVVVRDLVFFNERGLHFLHKKERITIDRRVRLVGSFQIGEECLKVGCFNAIYLSSDEIASYSFDEYGKAPESWKEQKSLAVELAFLACGLKGIKTPYNATPVFVGRGQDRTLSGVLVMLGYAPFETSLSLSSLLESKDWGVWKFKLDVPHLLLKVGRKDREVKLGYIIMETDKLRIYFYYGGKCVGGNIS